MNRRQFTKTAALAPIAMALGAELHSQQGVALPPTEDSAPQTPLQRKPAAAYNKRPPINEADPFC